MYLTYAGQFLDDKGALAPLRGRAKAMADFHAGVIAYATDFDDSCVTCRDVSSTRRALPRPHALTRATPKTGIALAAKPRDASRTGKPRYGTSASGRTRQAEVWGGTRGNRMPQVHR